MSCPICRRQACIQSFHSIEEQEKFEERQNMSDDVDTLRELLQAEQEENKELKKEIEISEKRIDRLERELYCGEQP